MAKFDDDLLKEEENLGGFEPGSDEDESFHLETIEAYPGNLPDYGILAEEEKVSIADQLKIPEAAPDPDEEVAPEEEEASGNIWDLFEQSAEAESVPDEEDDLLNIKSILEPKEEAEKVSAEDLFDTPKEEVEKPEPEQEFDEEQAKLEADINFLDPELIKLVNEEADRAKTRQIQTPEDKSEDTETEESYPIPPPPFESEVKATDEKGKEEEKKVTKKSKKKKEKPLKENIEDDEMETRKKLRYWKTVASIAAAILIIALFFNVEYFLRFQPKGYSFSEAIKEMPPFDWFSSNSETITTMKSQSSTTLTQVPEEISSGKLKSKHKKYDSSKKTMAEEPEYKPLKPIKKNEGEEVDKTSIDKSKTTVQKKSAKIARADNIPQKSTKKAAHLAKESSETQEQLYIVQVYTSPSKDDAEEWLKQLRHKNVSNAFLTTQKIRDKMWYRVRFGAFKTADEARNEAMKLGFAQSWIDRVR